MLPELVLLVPVVLEEIRHVHALVGRPVVALDHPARELLLGRELEGDERLPADEDLDAGEHRRIVHREPLEQRALPAPPAARVGRDEDVLLPGTVAPLDRLPELELGPEELREPVDDFTGHGAQTSSSSYPPDFAATAFGAISWMRTTCSPPGTFGSSRTTRHSRFWFGSLRLSDG